MPVIYFLSYVADRIRMGLGMLLPIFSDAKDSRSWNPWVRRVVHLILLGLILWGLWWVQKRWGWLNRNLVARAPEDVKPYYLCLVFLVLYAICWVGYGLKS